MGRAKDGSHIAESAGRLRFSCAACGEAFGTEQWWIVQYPQAVHTRCRDWQEVPFPFARHVDLLERATRVVDDEAVWYVRTAHRFFLAMRRSWPSPGADGVLRASELLRRLRAQLAGLHVDAKLVNQI